VAEIQNKGYFIGFKKVTKFFYQLKKWQIIVSDEK
jgi:hypothetical protein